MNFLVQVNIFKILHVYLSTAYELGVLSFAWFFSINYLHVLKDNYVAFFNEISYVLLL